MKIKIARSLQTYWIACRFSVFNAYHFAYTHEYKTCTVALELVEYNEITTENRYKSVKSREKI